MGRVPQIFIHPQYHDGESQYEIHCFLSVHLSRAYFCTVKVGHDCYPT